MSEVETAEVSGSQPEPVETSSDVQGETAAPEVTTPAPKEQEDRQSRNWRELERDRNYWREQALRTTQQPPPQPVATEPPVVSTPKTLADFEFDEAKYQSYLFSEAEKRAVNAAERRIREQQDQEKQVRRKSEFEKRESEFAKSVEDYIDVTRNPSVPINSDMAQVIAESEDGPALAYYLGKNVEIAERIAQLSPLAAAREMGRIEAKLAAEREKAKEKQVSKAPAPTPKIDATESAIEKNEAEMSDPEWYKHARRLGNLKQFKRKS